MAFMDKVKGMLGIPEDTDIDMDEDVAQDEEIEEKLPMLLDELVNYDRYYSATPV